MNIVVDIDHTICIAEVKNDKGDYENAKPITKMIDKINELWRQGHYIILYTARGMRTFKNNVKKVEKHHRPILEDWLKRHGVEHDELIFGKIWKPDYYFIDDKNLTINQFLENNPSDFKRLTEENRKSIL